jgi:hypothetical protein
VFDQLAGIAPGPYARPSTGPAVLRVGGRSGKFFFEGSGNRVGTAFLVTQLAPDLSSVRLVRYAANFIPRNAAVVPVVDDVNEHVGFWAPQPDFRIPERLSPGFTVFPDEELEDVYRDQVETFVEYQTAVGVRAIEQNPDADLVMIYIEQPDGSGHQWTLTDRRQATDPTDPTSVGWPGFPIGATGQDRAKLRRYAKLLEFGYQSADRAVEPIIQAGGADKHGEPRSNVFVVSDHGMAPFHTAVSLANLLVSKGVDLAGLGLRTSGPTAHVYVNLAGREAGGTVAPADYAARVEQVAAALRSAVDERTFFNPFNRPLFSPVLTRSNDCGQPGFCTSAEIGQDFGDVVALLAEGYNFDGIQSPGVARLGDPPFDAATSVFSVPNFYGAHGHDSELRSMSAILYAAGPDPKQQGRAIERVRNIDVAPTILAILGVAPAPTVDGRVIPKILKRP